jgi:phenylacetic acid degradation operon negative regulatory protein
LLSTLGEFVLHDREPVWTASLLHVLTGLNVDERTARQAISRAADAGLITAEKHGRAVRWTLTDVGARTIEQISDRVMSLGTPDAEWNGDWLILAVTVPQAQKAAREPLYRALHWAGFGNPMPVLWISPHVDRADELKNVVGALGLDDSAITFAGPTVSIGLSDAQIVRRAWDLQRVASRYERLISSFTDLDPEPGDDTLFSHVALVNEWRESPLVDPQLPEPLLPDWIGRRAMAMSVARYREWVKPARERWREVARLTAP